MLTGLEVEGFELQVLNVLQFGYADLKCFESWFTGLVVLPICYGLTVLGCFGCLFDGLAGLGVSV